MNDFVWPIAKGSRLPVMANKRSSDHLRATSGLPPTADIVISAMGSRGNRNLRFSAHGVIPVRGTHQRADRITNNPKTTSRRPNHIGNRICGERLPRQARLAQAIGELLGVRGVPEWQSADVIHVGVSRIDFFKFVPDPAGLIQMTQMAQR